ncbi:hypothetical protein LTR85_010110 [Meristemomyces frigidus]|nr:hypothetical protein LTR85_010110 [Meristemomyces frigidus]
MANWKPGDLILSIHSDSEELASAILPMAEEDEELLCWQPDYVCIACDDPYICLIGFNGSVVDVDYLASGLCMNDDTRGRVEELQLLESLKDIVSPKDILIVRPSADNVREHAHGGRCPSPHCNEGYIRSDNPIWECEGVFRKMWSDQPKEYRVCPFCVGLDLAADHDEYVRRLTLEGLVPEEEEFDFFRRLNERRALFNYRTIVRPQVSDGYDGDDEQSQDHDTQSDQGTEYTPDNYEPNPTSPQAVQDVIRLSYHRLQEENVPMAGTEFDTCSICQEPFGRDDIVARLSCKHILHSSCMEQALQQNAACPECRAPVVEKVAEGGMRDSAEINEATCGACHSLSRGPMLCCENARCPHRRPPRWYHIGCTNYGRRMVNKKWYCSTC